MVKSNIDLNKAKADDAEASSEQKQIATAHVATGQKHAENMEQQTAQSQGNQDLAVTKALLHPLKPDQSHPNIEAAVGFNKMSRQIDDTPPPPDNADFGSGAPPQMAPGGPPGSPQLTQDPSLGAQDPSQGADSVDNSQQSPDQDPSGVGGAPPMPGGQPSPGVTPNPGSPQ